MNILVLRVYNTYNIGSAMMAINLISSLNEQYDNVTFYTDITDERNLERLRESTNIKNLFMCDIEFTEPRNIFYRVVRKFLRGSFMHKAIYFSHLRKLSKRAANKYDKVFILGGDDLSKGYPIEGIRMQMHIIWKLSSELPVVLFGHTIGPFDEDLTSEFKKYLDKCSIYPRDKGTYNYLNNKVCPVQLKLTSDLAFLDLPKQTSDHTIILNRYNLQNTNYVTVIPSGLYMYYTENREIYIENWLRIIKSLLELNELLGYKILLLAHVTRPHEVDDSLIIEDILERFDEDTKKRVLKVCDSEILPYEARQVLGNGLFTVTGRMHGAISTFQTGKPAISISYSVKYKGIIGDDLGFENLIVEGNNPDEWNNFKVCRETIAKTKYVLNNYGSLRQKIKTNVKELKKNITNALENI